MLLIGLALLAAAGFRLVKLLLIPVFADEAIYIHWAQIAWHDHTQRFIALSDGKPPLHTWFLIPFLKAIKEPLLAGRLLSVFAGLTAILGLYLLVKKCFNRKIAVIAAFLAVCSPFLVFYERLATADSLLTAFGVWSFYLSLLLAEKPDLGRAFLLGFCWGGGLLVKQPALYFILLSFLNLFWQKTSIKKYGLFIKKNIFYWLVSLIIAVLIYNIIKLSPYPHLISARSYDYITGKKEFLQAPFRLFWGNFKAIIFWLKSYQLWPAVILFFAGLFLLLKDNFKKALIFLFWPAVPVLGSAFIGKIIFPRYFVFIQPWIIVFMAFGLNELMIKVKKQSRLIAWGLYLFAFLPWVWFSLLLVFNPVKAPLIEREQDQYLTSWSAGWGIKETADWLKDQHPEEKIFVATEGFFGTLPDGLQIYLDGKANIQVYGIGQPIHKIPLETLERAKTAPTYLLINSTRAGQFPEAELIKEYPKPEFPFFKESLLFYKIKE